MDNVVSTSTLFKEYKIKENSRTRRTERGDLLDLFLQSLNPPRVAVGLKPLSIPFLSRFFSMRKMPTAQIYQFYRDCERANNFSSYFWWATKVHE